MEVYATSILSEKEYLKRLKLRFSFCKHKFKMYTKTYFEKNYNKLKNKIIDYFYNQPYNKYVVIVSKY